MTSIAEKYAAQYQPNGEVSLADLIQAAVDEAQSVPVLSVWYGAMPETNGRSNWTALLHNGDFSTGFTVARSEYPDRVRYEADRVRYLIGELKDEPFILDYDAEKHSGYVEARSVAVVGEPVAWVNAVQLSRVRKGYLKNVYLHGESGREIDNLVALYLAPTHSIHAAELAALREKAAEADELRKDAERYRWLSYNSSYGIHEMLFGKPAFASLHKESDLADCIDAQLDAAIAGEKNHG